MKYGDFLTALRQEEPKHIYLLSGGEDYYLDRAEKAVLARLFPDKSGADTMTKCDGEVTVSELMALLSTAPFFTDKNVVLIKNTNLFKEKKATTPTEAAPPQRGKRPRAKPADRSDELISFLENMPDYSYLILRAAGKADKRLKLYKLCDKLGLALEADPIKPKPREIREYLAEKLADIDKELTPEAWNYLTGILSLMKELPLAYLDGEFAKLALYTDKRRIEQKDLAMVFSGLPEVSLFALSDAITSRDTAKAIGLLRRQLHDGVYHTLLVGVIARQIRQLWQIKDLLSLGRNPKEIGSLLGLHPYVGELLGRAAQHFTVATLKAAMLELSDADYCLKTGRGGVELLEHVLILLGTGGREDCR